MLPTAKIPGLNRIQVLVPGPEPLQASDYNPFDVLHLLADREFKAWWCATGSPTFLVDTLVRRSKILLRA
ncbi:MAG: hypothetical protein OXH99_22465 [Bryobacterales bacterium]|nr:hypothetical protein [Bryobacterales bacterium]